MLGKEIEVQKMSEYQKLLAVQMAEMSDYDLPYLDERLRIEGVSSLISESLASAGFDTLRKLMKADPSEIPVKVPGVNYYDLADKILEQMRKKKG
jgi:N utilization substance protein A